MQLLPLFRPDVERTLRYYKGGLFKNFAQEDMFKHIDSSENQKYIDFVEHQKLFNSVARQLRSTGAADAPSSVSLSRVPRSLITETVPCDPAATELQVVAYNNKVDTVCTSFNRFSDSWSSTFTKTSFVERRRRDHESYNSGVRGDWTPTTCADPSENLSVRNREYEAHDADGSLGRFVGSILSQHTNLSTEGWKDVVLLLPEHGNMLFSGFSYIFSNSITFKIFWEGYKLYSFAGNFQNLLLLLYCVSNIEQNSLYGCLCFSSYNSLKEGFLSPAYSVVCAPFKVAANAAYDGYKLAEKRVHDSINAGKRAIISIFVVSTLGAFIQYNQEALLSLFRPLFASPALETPHAVRSEFFKSVIDVSRNLGTLLGETSNAFKRGFFEPFFKDLLETLKSLNKNKAIEAK